MTPQHWFPFLTVLENYYFNLAPTAMRGMEPLMGICYQHPIIGLWSTTPIVTEWKLSTGLISL
jgi:hypothetical protein